MGRRLGSLPLSLARPVTPHTGRWPGTSKREVPLYTPAESRRTGPDWGREETVSDPEVNRPRTLIVVGIVVAFWAGCAGLVIWALAHMVDWV